MLFGYLLTNTAQIFADVRTYWSPTPSSASPATSSPADAEGGILHLINSGAADARRHRRADRATASPR